MLAVGTYHVSEAARNTISCHGPEESVQTACLLAEEVPCRVVGRGSLRNLIVRRWFDRVDQVGELNCILDEEDWDVVADNI